MQGISPLAKRPSGRAASSIGVWWQDCQPPQWDRELAATLFGEEAWEAKGRETKTKCSSRLANMQAQTLILIKCSWLGWVKREQQQAGITQLYSPRHRRVFSRNLLVSLRRGLRTHSLAEHALFSQEAKISLAFLVIWPDSWCFHLVNGGSPSFSQAAAPGAFARDKSKSTWKLMP